jgi:L-aminopeptidase/D-esterase-like protein
VPIVPAAALYDLGIGSEVAYPTAVDGRVACESASKEFACGNVGAGIGATVGKIHGHEFATRGGVGSAGWQTDDGLLVGAVVAVNAFGDVLMPDTGKIIAGSRTSDGSPRDSALSLITGDQPLIKFGSNTTLCVMATNAKLTKAQAKTVSRIAQTGVSRSISPCHTQYDGDMVFSLSTEESSFDINRIGVLASKVIEAAIIDAVLTATPAKGIPCARDLGWYKALVQGDSL